MMNTARKFTRVEEDFVCEHCGFSVQGSGYTNHCPKCLWSKHVDVNPGDRQATCHGLMRPLRMEIKQEKYIIVHKCEKCGYEKRNKSAENDDFDMILQLSKQQQP